MDRPSHDRVEALLAQLDAIQAGSKQSFELWVPQSLTFRGQPNPLDLAMALILDKILGKGYEPDDFTEGEGGRIYRYKASR